MNDPWSGYVATTIIQQLGGLGPLRAMTGAKEFVCGKHWLRFKIGRNAKRVNKVKIQLDPDDTYSMEFLRVTAAKTTTKASIDGVYADMLVPIFEAETGMYIKF